MLPKYPGLYIAAFAVSGLFTAAYGQSPHPAGKHSKKDTSVYRAVAQPWTQADFTPFKEQPSAKRKKKQEKATTPFSEMVQTDSTTFTISGRKIQLHKSGFPAQITSYISPDLSRVDTTPYPMLTEQVHFHIVNAATHKDIAFTSKGITFLRQKTDSSIWTAVNTSPLLQMDVTGKIYANSQLSFNVTLTALQNVELDEIRMHLPFTFATGEYFTGLGYAGGVRPDTVNWKWDGPVAYGRGAWIGSSNAGMWYLLEDDQRNSNSTPASWSNNGKGGVWVGIKGKSVLADNYSGKRSMRQGEVLHYNFSMDITPHTGRKGTF
ncbi:hypothetical protein HNQ91_001387 [Filimonas zeae]|uniref:Glycoside hydrolase 123-like N-terminal domain-containing protein n=1 Tax=Filimonas zeae TaxID=1737353 RepID=A0A917IZT4_9BACT|nr:glycoside hydrolase domain-containing protein [Filimonas zeae]MDR6338336.1 hypothetical protein [Filimonas zeae]GGH68740.1 hypothetical protein GCM10011379_25380 [Filimonas zeae]